MTFVTVGLMVAKYFFHLKMLWSMSEKKSVQTAVVPTEINLPDPAEVSAAMSRIAESSQRLIVEFLERQEENKTAINFDPMNMGGAFLDLTNRLMADPAYLFKAQLNLWQSYANLWQHATQKFIGEETSPIATPNRDDRRFKDPAW